jgi:hypothetical protein
MTGIQHLTSSAQDSKFLNEINNLSRLHYLQSSTYKRVVDSLFSGKPTVSSLNDIPFLPVTLFKDFELKSISDDDVYKVLLSSGTQGKQSKIFLNRENSRNQSHALHQLFKNKFGQSRNPMIIFDTESQILSKQSANARKAAVIGFSAFASKRYFVLDEDLSLKRDYLKELSERYVDQPVLLFGFTYLIWKTLSHEVQKDGSVKFSMGKLLHGGGWKKLENLGLTNAQFKTTVSKVLGIREVYDYYGMAEQAGSIYFECTAGFFHTTEFGGIIVRDMITLEVLQPGQQGVLHVLSTLPTSYPGHSILTQDIGTLHGINDCVCGQAGRYFTVDGRLPRSEVRGCSDVIV